MSKSLCITFQINMKLLSGKKQHNTLWQHKEKNHRIWSPPLQLYHRKGFRREGVGQNEELTLIQPRGAFHPYKACFWQRAEFGLCHQLCHTGAAAGSWTARPQEVLAKSVAYLCSERSMFTITYRVGNNALCKNNIMV